MIDAIDQKRPQALTRMLKKELQHLPRIGARLFARPFTVEMAVRLDREGDLATAWAAH